MAATMACIAGEEIYRQWDAGRIAGEKIGVRQTPFGASSEVFLVREPGPSYYLLPRHGVGLSKTSPGKVNYRANMYALKDLGAQCVIAWGPCGAITHNIAIGELVVLSDLIDRTYLRAKTFFEDSPLGFLRQFPVFCPSLRRGLGEVLHGMRVIYHGGGTAAVFEGPRFETAAEIRMMAAGGAEVVTHTFVPEVFLARELELCYAAVCYVVNYAETGSPHRPFTPGSLFGELDTNPDRQRIQAAVGAMTEIVRHCGEVVADGPSSCTCDQTMAGNVKEYGLSPDFRTWFE